jgi:hypothetical protein
MLLVTLLSASKELFEFQVFYPEEILTRSPLMSIFVKYYSPSEDGNLQVLEIS